MFGLTKKGVYDYLLVGLGNPGAKYADTRHNVGFMTVDILSAELMAGPTKKKHKSEIMDCKIGDNKCLLCKPQTFMNNSGLAVKEIANYYKIPTENIIVISDDVSLDVGSLRIRRKGSDGGHNGLKSIINLIGSNNFPRVKIGVGKKPHPEYDLADWVLGRFQKADRDKISQSIKDAAAAVKCIIKNGTDSAMNMYNR